MEESKRRKILFCTGMSLIVASLVLFVLIFYPVLWQEYRYLRYQSFDQSVLTTQEQYDTLEHANDAFSILIPKIGASAPIIADVDPMNESAYFHALRDGVAHAKDTRKPGEPGNMFLFAHSSGNFYADNRYNTIFYLINKLGIGDEISILYEKKLYVYAVTGKDIVSSNAVEYLEGKSDKSTVTLMTCWPAGTSAKRLLVYGVLSRVDDSR